MQTNQTNSARCYGLLPEIWSTVILDSTCPDALNKQTFLSQLVDKRLVCQLFNRCVLEKLKESSYLVSHFKSIKLKHLFVVTTPLPNFAFKPLYQVVHLNLFKHMAFANFLIEKNSALNVPAIEKAQVFNALCQKIKEKNFSCSKNYEIAMIECFTEAAMIDAKKAENRIGDKDPETAIGLRSCSTAATLPVSIVEKSAVEDKVHDLKPIDPETWLNNQIAESSHIHLIHLGLAKTYFAQRKNDEGTAQLKRAIVLWYADLKAGSPSMRDLCDSKYHSLFLDELNIDIKKAMNQYLNSVIQKIENQHEDKEQAYEWLCSVFTHDGVAPAFDEEKKSKALGLIIKSWEWGRIKRLSALCPNDNQIRQLFTNIIKKLANDNEINIGFSEPFIWYLCPDKLEITLNKDISGIKSLNPFFVKDYVPEAFRESYRHALVLKKDDNWEEFKKLILKETGNK